ncbi:MAG: ABC transporter ATP-binding protein [Chloroflexi bacterium]|nr:ABC transporter ATP-binding protein [Chloroflexota bacterium]
MNIPLKDYWQLFAKYLRPQMPRAIALTVLLLVGIALRVVNPQIVRHFIDQAQSGAALDSLYLAGGTFLGFALITQALSIITIYLSESVGWTATNNLRADLALHALRLDMTFHNDKTPGDMIERIDGDVMDLAVFFSQLVVRIFGNAVLLIGVLVALTLENWRIGLAYLVFCSATMYGLRFFSARAEPFWKKARDAHSDLFGFLEERLGGTEDLRSSGAGAYVIKRLYAFGRQMTKTEKDAGVNGVYVWMTFSFAHGIGFMLALLTGTLLVKSGAISIGTAFLLVYYNDVLFEPMRHLTMQLENFQKSAASIARLRELLARTSRIQSVGSAHLPAGSALRLHFDDVTFGYAVNDPVLRNVSFDLPPGRVIGVLGRTGSGKTTLARLIFRLYDVTNGAVRLSTPDGHTVDIRDLPITELPQRVGMVTQDVQIFRGTVRQNLTLFDASIPDVRVREVIDDLELGEWFARQPNGLDSDLESGGKGLSAGEAQLLAFARVFLRNPGLVILDEASSRLDPATERRIEHAIDKLLGDHSRSALIIAHRLSTVQRADQILILERGGVVEQGERIALVQDENSRFSRLLRAQAG